MFRNHLIVLSTVLVLLGIGIPSDAFAGHGAVTLNFFTPERLDPNKVVTFFDTNTIAVTGADLTVPETEFPNVKGTEIHSQIPTGMKGVYQSIDSVMICFHYDGVVQGASFGTSSPDWAPWSTSEIQDPLTNYYCFTFTKQMGSAPINDSFDPGFLDTSPFHVSFGTATVTGADDDLAAFAMQNDGRGNSGVTITPGSTVPEMNSLSSLGGLLAAGGSVLWLKWRRRYAA